MTNEFFAAYSDFRLYPTTLSHKHQGGDGLTYYKYHMTVLQNDGEPFGGDPWNEFNEYWFQTDEFMYNNLATDAFVIGFDAKGMVQSVECQALRSVYYRS
jgi:hypothetical protein